MRILCYGDSNTWGFSPITMRRYPVGVRWTSLLQEKLGNDYEVIEEGLNGRTTVLDDPDDEGRNGKTYLLPCLQSQDPINIFILLLGTNDLKEEFHRTPEQIAQGVEELITVINNAYYFDGKAPKVFLLAPPIIDESVNGVQENYLGAEEKSKKLGALYKQLAEKYGLAFLDLSQHIRPSKQDGCHIDAEDHKKISELLIKEILSLA